MATTLNDNIRLEAGKNLDDRYLNGIAPWTDAAAVNTAIVPSRRYKGLTVLIGVEEYWYRNGIANGDLIIKQGTSEGIAITARGLWKYDAATAIAPATGKLRFDSLTIGSITNAYLSQTTDDAVDAGFLFDSLAPGDVLFMQQRDDATRWFRLLINGPLVDAGTWWTFPIVVIDSGGLYPVVDAQVILRFILSGGVVPSDHFKGSYATLAALQAAVPAGVPGDYALVDVAASDAILYIWDATDTAWVQSGGTGVGGAASLFLTEYFTGNGIATVFTVPAAEAIKITAVYVGGQRMQEGVHYTKDETAKTVTLTSVIATGIGIDVEYFTTLGSVSSLPHWDMSTWGLARVATQVETNAGVDDSKGITPLKLAVWASTFVPTGGGAAVLEYACSDEMSVLTTGLKLTVRSPAAFTLTKVRASLVTAQASGSILTIDIKKNGTSLLSTLLTIDNTELTSKTAAIAAVISTSAIADDDVITVHITQVGDGTATGLKVKLYP